MIVKPTKDGSRLVKINNPYLLFICTVDRSGSVTVEAHEHRDPRKSRGLGDTIAKATKAVGIKPCGGCKKRQAKLNKLIPYKDAP
jgi:hypothetical protein